ncbi:hypothetical protein HV403_15730 [Bacillus sporothermodurans]|uniref:PKD domain-containing protein n=1 Tax=Heyndrickxia sporothermodurans TaxID=46224 RepID=UPI00192ACCF0|nr:PKD domain-containing protein [Heyndrickxia sporothermodurans]MBL5776188.1 hypothetical protein [Heyndrickxia sporothermodurans]MBL5836232.1 hypothetical protein [Heyndrickxia sporothermodurans]MBL5881651.1 hypothetical protein [Heyndrickxia sporothermodurans]MBL5893078.1 hypothetical protein [Heyndrickxia sporothermodurans]
MKKSKILFLLTLLLLTLTLFDNYSSKAATGDENIYSIPSSVKNDWNKVWGGKSFSMTSGKDLVYDIYDNKYMEDGYTITTRDFGKGEQKYLRFRGWAVLFGYKKHTPTNQDTFIVAHKVSGSGIGTQKIYKAVQKGLNATEDLEFNNQGSGVWNECPASATNKRNDECNMRYEDTSFDAYLPLDELFKNKYEKASWKLVLVKKVSSNIVYTPLIFPFEFDDRNYNGGKISLSSGFNAKTLRMNSEQVLRRSKPRESASSVTDDLGSDRYFTQNQDYTNVDSDESQTAVWYGVRSPKDKNKTKWAATSYWTFRGDQGSLSYEPPNRPPVAEFSTSPSKIYNDTTITFNNTSSDPDKDKLTYKWQIKPQGTSDSNYTTFSTSKSPTKKLAKGNYTVQLTVSDGKATNSVKHGVIVSNRPPVAAFNTTPTSDIYYNTKITFNNTSSDPDKDKLTYKWEIKPRYTADSEYTTFSTSLTPTKILPKGEYTVQLTVSDGVDSNSYKRAVIVNNSPPVAAFTYSPTTVYNDTTVTFTNGSSDPDKDKLTYKWEYQEPNSTAWTQFSTTTSPTKVLNKKGDWNIRLTANDGEASTSITKKITVGNRPPVAAFTYSPTTVYNDTTVTFTNGSSDPDKDKLTYKWEYQEPNSTAWTQFSTTTSPTKVLNKKGDWNIRLTVNDGTTSTSITKKITVGNRPPVAAFTYSPTTVYNDTTVTFTNGSSDPDKDKLTYQWEYQEPNSTTWTQFSTTTSPTKVLNKKGDWNIRVNEHIIPDTLFQITPVNLPK